MKKVALCEPLSFSISYLKAIQRRKKYHPTSYIILVTDGDEFYAVVNGDKQELADTLICMTADDPHFDKVINKVGREKKYYKELRKQGLVPKIQIQSANDAILELEEKEDKQ